MHENYHRTEDMPVGSERGFGVVFTIVFLIIGAWPLLSGPEDGQSITWRDANGWAVVLAALLLIVTIVRPSLLAGAKRVWMKFAALLQKIVNPLVMAILFFGIVTPFGLVMRLLGKDPMQRQLEPEAATYWSDRTGEAAKTSMKNQF